MFSTLNTYRTSLVAQTVEHLAYNAGDLGSILGSGRSSGEGSGNPPSLASRGPLAWPQLRGYSL